MVLSLISSVQQIFIEQQALSSLHSFISVCTQHLKKCLVHHLAVFILCPKFSCTYFWPCSAPCGTDSCGSLAFQLRVGFHHGRLRMGEKHIRVPVALLPCLPLGLVLAVVVSPAPQLQSGSPSPVAPAISGGQQHPSLLIPLYPERVVTNSFVSSLNPIYRNVNGVFIVFS